MSAGVARLLDWPTARSGDLLRGAETWLRTSLESRPPVEVTTWLDLSAHRIRAAELGPALHRFVGGGTY